MRALHAVLIGCLLSLGCAAEPVPAAPPSCVDGAKNGQEIDVDCGGICQPCGDGRACTAATDCVTGACRDGVCQAPSCSDGVRNGAEIDVDCGGPGCPACADGGVCRAAGDCGSGVCLGNRCRPQSCTDGVKSGGEVDVDCGGGCPGCGEGRACAAAGDCAAGVCQAGRCQAPSCTDRVKNGGETDADCGGPCGRCGPGKACATAGDCDARLACSGGQCLGDSCRTVLLAQPTATSGPYSIDPDGPGGAAPLSVFCDMTTESGGWTFVATITNTGDGVDQGSWLHGAVAANNRWEGTDTFGDADPTKNADFRSAAFHLLRGKALLITHRNQFLLRTNDSCLGDGTLRQRFAGLGWTCGASVNLAGNGCANACSIAASTPRVGDTALLNGATRASLFFKAGEANGVEDVNRDRSYLSTDARANVSTLMGLGAQCTGGSCSPRVGDADVNDSSDAVVPTAGTEFYGLWVR